MKILTIKTIMIIIFALIICGFSTSFGMQHYYNTNFTTGITKSNLNVRSGPGTRI